MIDVRIEQHKGIHMATGRETYLPQDRVFADGRMLGYLSHTTPPALSLVCPASPAEIVAVSEKIKELRKYPPKIRGPAPPIPPEMLKQDDEDEDDDE